MKREDFLAGRKAGLGGSDIGAILGLSKFKSAVDVWLDKTGRSQYSESTIPQRLGIFAEEFVAQEYTIKTGRKVVRHNAQLVHPDYPFLIGNVDRLVVPHGEKIAAFKGQIRTDRGMEAKAVSAFAGGEWGEDDTDDVPPYYLTQCAWYRILTGCQFWDLAALIGNFRVEVYSLERDRELEELLVARAVEFWQNHVLTDIPPDPQSESDVKALYPRHQDGKRIKADQQVLELLDALKQERDFKKESEERETTILTDLKKRMQDAEALIIEGMDGKPLATWKTNKDSRKIDYEQAFMQAIMKLEPSQIDKVSKELLAANTAYKVGARPFLLK